VRENGGISERDRSTRSLETVESSAAHRQRKSLYPTVGLYTVGVLMWELSVSGLSLSLSRIRIPLVLPLLPRRLDAGRLRLWGTIAE